MTWPAGASLVAFYQAPLFILIVVSAVCRQDRHSVAGRQEGWTEEERQTEVGEREEGVDIGDLH